MIIKYLLLNVTRMAIPSIGIGIGELDIYKLDSDWQRIRHLWCDGSLPLVGMYWCWWKQPLFSFNGKLTPAELSVHCIVFSGRYVDKVKVM